MTDRELLQHVLSYLARGDAPDSKYPDRSGEYWTLCPFHPDQHAKNFSVSTRGYHCFTCGAEGGLLELAEHFGINGSNPKRSKAKGQFDFDNVVARYSYHDADGLETYQVWKDGNKSFMPMHQAEGGRKGGYPPSGRVLYRLPEVLAAETVYLAEGEKSTEAVRALGLTATTIPGGANGRWCDSYTDALEGRDVIILPDNDAAGQALVNKATRKLQGRARSVSVAVIPGLADGQDIEDYIDLGHGREDIEALELQTPAVQAPKRDTWPYALEDGRIVYQKRQSEEEIVSIPVADFTASITHEITTEYGDRHYRMAGEAVAGGPFTAEIKAEDFAETRQLVATLDAAAGALDPVRSGMRRHLGPAIKLLSRDSDIQHWRRFERVGWEGRRYLIPGRLGDRVECHTDRCLPFACPSDADLSQGTEALEHLLGALDPTITAPVIGYMLLPAIARVAGLHNERFGLFIVGRTGVLKTSYMQAALCCWGPGFLEDDSLLKWGEGATRNAIMALATQAADAPLLIDNYKPGTGGGAEHFIALWHNIVEGGDRRRLDRTAKLKETRPVWAWPIATGEAVPSEDAATLARMLVVQFEWARGENNEDLARAQVLASHLPAVLGALLDWLENDGREVAKDRGEAFPMLRQDHAMKMLKVEAEAINARRMGSSLATLDIGWAILTAHPQLGPLFHQYTSAFVAGLEKIAAWQAHHSLEALEARQFLDGLRKLLDSGRLWLADNRDMGTEEAQERRHGFVGWRDGEGGAYVLPDAITLVKSMIGTRLNGVSDGQIYSQLAEIDALAGSSKGRNTYRVRVGPAGKENPRTLWLSTEALGQEG